jgi:cytochrome c biogenesis protein ResB
MKIIKNRLIPFKGFGAMNILGLVFTRKNAEEISITTKRHEQIHTMQQYEILGASALISLVLCNIWASWWYLLVTIALPIALYVLVWLIELALPPYDSAYKDSLFEREAFANQHDHDYLVTRPLFAWVKYWVDWRSRNRK